MLSCQHEKIIAAGRSFKIDGAEKERAGEGHFPVVARQPHHLARSSASPPVPCGESSTSPPPPVQPHHLAYKYPRGCGGSSPRPSSNLRAQRAPYSSPSHQLLFRPSREFPPRGQGRGSPSRALFSLCGRAISSLSDATYTTARASRKPPNSTEAVARECAQTALRICPPLRSGKGLPRLPDAPSCRCASAAMAQPFNTGRKHHDRQQETHAPRLHREEIHRQGGHRKEPLARHRERLDAPRRQGLRRES